ncbi:MAG: tetratricopeptide repeat protein [Planctomycetota bacterium]
MKRINGSSIVGSTLLIVAMGVLAPSAFMPVVDAQDKSNNDEVESESGSDLSEDELRQVKTAERFVSILRKNPRRGTALDRVYGHHVEFGSLDRFMQDLRDQSAQSDDDGSTSMLLGMFESQRGNDGDAVDAFLIAETRRPDDALASFYLGQSQLRIGQSEEAVASFERAISRKPSRMDVLEVYQQLGRVHQRAQRTEEALGVWKRLESLFPDDPRVLEQIAITLTEEGQPELALPRYERLAELVRDDYRRVTFLVAAAELRIKTGRRDEGIASLESVLANLNPEGWLYRDVRRRIDDVFLRSGDQDNLVKYYERWLESHPEDVEGMSRLARFLASSARVPEANQWMEKALQLAPSRSDLRKNFIDQLVNDQRFDDAIAQYEQLIKVAPNNPDFLRDWGKLVLRNKQQDLQERQRIATNIWNRIVDARPDDALTAAQVADLYRQNGLPERAETLYRKAAALAPADPQYREYLGEFLHIQKRPDEALEVWSQIAAGERRTASNLTRLAEVYNSFGFPEKAVVEIAEAVAMDPKDFSLQIRAAEYHSRAGQFDEAIRHVDSAGSIATNDEEKDAVIRQRIEVLQTSQRLENETDELADKVRENDNATAIDWYLLARYLEASRRWADASEAVDNAIRLAPKSVVALTAAARIAETSGDYGRAADLSRNLADLDRRSRGDHLMNVARLEAQMGRSEEALTAAQQLIVSAPGNTDNYEFYAQMCFRLGKPEDGLEAFRKAVRINPNEPHLIMAMGSALADQLRTDEAIELYWRAFDKSDEVEDKVSLTMKLTPLYEQVNRFDKLIERFERDRREEDRRRELTICLAQAWHTAGDFGAARQELESLLSQDTRDTNLLSQLAKLCQDGADLDAAVGYQRQLVSIAPGHETEFPLAGMLMQNGRRDEAREIYVKLTQREEDPVRQMKAIDSLLSQGNHEAVINVIEPLLSQQRDDWELLYREAVAWAALEKTDEARNRLERLLSLKLPYDALGRSAQAKLKQAQTKAKSNNLRGIRTTVPQSQSPLAMRNMSSQVQRSTGLMADNRYYAPGRTPPIWTPEAYGVARMAAFGWIMKFEDEEQAQTERTDVAISEDADQDIKDASDDSPQKMKMSLKETVRSLADAEDAPRNAVYDALYVASLTNDYPGIFDIARRLAIVGEREEKQFFLSSLRTRQLDKNQLGQTSSSSQKKSNRTPLSEEDLQLARAW